MKTCQLFFHSCIFATAIVFFASKLWQVAFVNLTGPDLVYCVTNLDPSVGVGEG